MQDYVEWNVGDQIVISSTSFNHTEAETKTISFVIDNEIHVEEPFEFQHLSKVIEGQYANS